MTDAHWTFDDILFQLTQLHRTLHRYVKQSCWINKDERIDNTAANQPSTIYLTIHLERIYNRQQ